MNTPLMLPGQYCCEKAVGTGKQICPKCEKINAGYQGCLGPARNIPAQEHARAYLKRYTASDKVSDLYDEDEEFANALHDLIGPSFEYPDWSHKTVGEILKQFERK